MPEKYVFILKALHQQTSGRVRIYEQLSLLLLSPAVFGRDSQSVRSSLTLPCWAFGGVASCGVEQYPGSTVVDLD